MTHIKKRIQQYYYVYIVTNKPNGVLYIGFTSDIKKRIWQHKHKVVDSFSKKFNTDKLVYFEQFEDVQQAIHREKCIKRWKRDWKIEKIEEINPNWDDLCFMDI